MAVLTKQFAESRGSDLALADDNATLTWAELDERVDRLINALREAGIGSGDYLGEHWLATFAVLALEQGPD